MLDGFVTQDGMETSKGLFKKYVTPPIVFFRPHPLFTPKTIDDGRTITIKTRKETRFRRNMIFIQTKLLLPNVNKLKVKWLLFSGLTLAHVCS